MSKTYLTYPINLQEELLAQNRPIKTKRKSLLDLKQI
jgi:hypothetical protein